MGSKTAYLTRLWTVSVSGSKTAYLTRFCKGAGGPEIAISREMAWGRHSIQFPKHSAMPGVVHESGDEPVEKSVEKTVEKTVEKAMMYYYAINNVGNSMMYYLCY